MAKPKPEDTPPEETTPPEKEAPQSLRIKYTGPTVHTRVLNASDFKSAGIEDVGKKQWDLGNNHTVDFGEYEGDKDALVRYFENSLHGGDFKVLQPGEL